MTNNERAQKRLERQHDLGFYASASDYARYQLIQELKKSHPTDPTLVDNFQARHVLAHLYMREHYPLSSLGMNMKRIIFFSDHGRKTLDEIADQALEPQKYQELLNCFIAGSPFWLQGITRPSQLSEYYVRREDLRRARQDYNPSTKIDPEYFQDALWNEFLIKGALAYHDTDVGVVAVRPDGVRHVIRPNSRSVAIIGEPSEILLHAHGRSKTNVKLIGEDDAITILGVPRKYFDFSMKK